MTQAYVPEAGGYRLAEFRFSSRARAGWEPTGCYTRSFDIQCTARTYVVLSNDDQAQGYPFEGLLSSVRSSVVLADHIKNFDWKTRKAKRKGVLSAAELAEVRAKAMALIAAPRPPRFA